MLAEGNASPFPLEVSRRPFSNPCGLTRAYRAAPRCRSAKLGELRETGEAWTRERSAVRSAPLLVSFRRSVFQYRRAEHAASRSRATRRPCASDQSGKAEGQPRSGPSGRRMSRVPTVGLCRGVGRSLCTRADHGGRTGVRVEWSRHRKRCLRTVAFARGVSTRRRVTRHRVTWGSFNEERAELGARIDLVLASTPIS